MMLTARAPYTTRQTVRREPVAELDVLAPELEDLVEDAAFDQEAALARGPASPEVLEVEGCAVGDAGIREQMASRLGHEAHQRVVGH